jgi:hypothetical protein
VFAFEKFKIITKPEEKLLLLRCQFLVATRWLAFLAVMNDRSANYDGKIGKATIAAKQK